MKRGSTLFLKAVILLIGIGVFAALIWEPQIEGRNAHADQLSIYFKDPFLVYIYIAFTPFFVALYQAIKLLGYIENDKVFSPISVNALRNIKYCAIALTGFIATAVMYVFIMAKITNDDGTGAVAIGLVITFASLVIATAAGVFQKLLQSAVDIKSENDLTV